LAAAELPNQQWSEVTTLLVNNITNVQSTVPLKQATLETIGYICEETVSVTMTIYLSQYDDIRMQDI